MTGKKKGQKKLVATSEERAMANQSNCSEIVHGIPTSLKDIIFEEDLPFVFEEPEQPPEPKPRNLEATRLPI